MDSQTSQNTCVKHTSQDRSKNMATSDDCQPSFKYLMHLEDANFFECSGPIRIHLDIFKKPCMSIPYDNYTRGMALLEEMSGATPNSGINWEDIQQLADCFTCRSHRDRIPFQLHGWWKILFHASIPIYMIYEDDNGRNRRKYLHSFPRWNIERESDINRQERYEKTFLLRQMLSNGFFTEPCEDISAATTDSEPHKVNDDDDNECPICYLPTTQDCANKVTECTVQCKKRMHAQCLLPWIDHCLSHSWDIACPHCRAVWKDDYEMKRGLRIEREHTLVYYDN
jgi:hypothetical protein